MGVAFVIGADDKTDVNHRKADGSTPLQWAVYEGDAAKVRELIRAGADVSLANDYGASPMGLAAEVADTAILKLLLDAGANADSPNADGMTALMLVARTGNVEAAKVLLEHGATIDAREGFGGQTALMWAAARRHAPMIDLLVISRGAAVDARSAVRDYQRHIQAEGRPKSLDTGGFTPLLYAARENCMACVDTLAGERRRHRSAGSRRRHAAAHRDHECELGLGEEVDRGRRRRAAVGHLRRGAAVHRRRRPFA